MTKRLDPSVARAIGDAIAQSLIYGGPVVVVRNLASNRTHAIDPGLMGPGAMMYQIGPSYTATIDERGAVVVSHG